MKDEGIRPSVLAIAALVAIGCVFAVYETFSFEPLGAASHAEADDEPEHGRRGTEGSPHGR